MERLEVHSHSDYSNPRLLDSINKIENLINKAIELGLSGIAITDHETLAGHIKANKYAQKIKEEHPNFKVVLGNEIYLVDEREKGQKYYHFILLAKDAIGHRQLRELSSLAWMNSYVDRFMERVPTLKRDLFNIIMKNRGHLIATSACIGGELSSNVLEMYKARIIGDIETEQKCHKKIEDFLDLMMQLFGDDFYIECAPGKSDDQIVVNKFLANIAEQYHIRMVVGTDAHYLTKEDRYVHKAYLNSKGGEREVDAFYEYSYLQSNDEIIDNLKFSGFDLNFIVDMFRNSMNIYDKIENYSLLHKQTIPKVEVKNYERWTRKPYGNNEKLNNYPTLVDLFMSEDKIERYWVNECVNKLYKLGKANDKYMSRLEEEARVKRIIGKKLETNMFAYPVTLQHYVDTFWRCGSLVGAGRGSSCSGLNHYLLGITQLDPIEWGLPFWRYLNEDRTELGDMDLDLCSSRRTAIINDIKKERGKNFASYIDKQSMDNLGCTLIATFGTETTKSAILTACRGYRSEDYPDGIDIDTANYLSSLIPQERGFLWTLKDVVYGNVEKGRKPVQTFINEGEKYPGLMDIMFAIEGLIKQRGSHASGVILFDDDPYEFGCFMKTPSGDIITQYDLHDAEAAGLTKYDFLVTEVQDKLLYTIKLLQKYGEIEKDLSLREIYNKYFHPNVLPLDKKEYWKALEEGTVLNIFQFDSDVGSQAAKKIQPQSILEMTDANGLMRLMTAEKGEETPMEKYIRFKNNINLWYEEMDREGLSKEEQKTLEPYFLSSYGVPPSQEQMMRMLMDRDICNFTLAEANDARKIVGKKQMSRIPELKEKVLSRAKNNNLGQYVWKRGVSLQLGYAFSVIHALAYSFIGYQTLHAACNWNSIYWDTACLIVNSGSLEQDNDSQKEKATDYGKIAKAIGDITSRGINVSLVDINKSSLSFEPNIENNEILFGMKALSGINADVIKMIEEKRPFASFKDFLLRCPIGKVGTLNLIKAGAFDELEKEGLGNRKNIMAYYISIISEPKKRLTLQNFNGLIQHNLIPKELEMQLRIFNFNKYIKIKKIGKYYTFDEPCEEFFNRFLSDYLEELEVINGITCILQTAWDKIYKKYMEPARNYLKENQEEMLKEYNKELFLEQWKKYAKGTISHWEMESMCFYHGEHELKNVNKNKYGIVNFNSLKSEEIDYFFKRAGRQIPIYKLYKIIGTVIDKNDSRSTVTILTTTGVVTVKFTREYYAMFKKQISDIGADGKKHVVEKSWFTRGTMIMVTGFRRDDMFIAKTYANTGSHQLYKITEIDGEDIKIQHERYSSESAEEIDYE